LLKKAGVLKNEEKWGKTGKKRAKNGTAPILCGTIPFLYKVRV